MKRKDYHTTYIGIIVATLLIVGISFLFYGDGNVGEAKRLSLPPTPGQKLPATPSPSLTNVRIYEDVPYSYSVAGTTYYAEALVVTQTAVKLRINGEITGELKQGQTELLIDGSKIHITDIYARKAVEYSHYR